MLVGDATGVSGLATALEGILTADAFMTALTGLVGVISGVLIFSFIYRTVRRMISGAPKGKAKI